ncbi:MAG: hypothetical protein II568_01155 [Erysipelotrichaceae bacterium]|nr:hypothetical protein [Erysipelotrichaceae bacterium]
MKKIDEMSDHELLRELVEEKRRNDIIQWAILLLVVFIAVFTYIQVRRYMPMVTDLVDRANVLMVDLEANSKQVEEVFNSLNDGSIDQFKGVMQQFNDGSIEQFKNVVDQLNDGTIDKLKNLINQLDSIVSLFKR